MNDGAAWLYFISLNLLKLEVNLPCVKTKLFISDLHKRANARVPCDHVNVVSCLSTGKGNIMSRPGIELQQQVVL
jgi:hypothetical protein